MKGQSELTYQKGQSEYQVQMKNKKRNWWWLLLLLLLVFFIPYTADVEIKTIDANDNPISGQTVNFDYKSRHLIDFADFGFLTNKTIASVQTTNENGLSAFKVRTSVFSRIFFGAENAHATAGTDCFAGDSIQKSLHRYYPGANNLVLSYKSVTLDFQVLDKENNQPIPDANVDVLVTVNGTEFLNENRETDPNGVVVLENIPQCAQISVTGHKDGYRDDHIAKKTAELSANLDTNRTLRLEPLKEKLEFIVKNLHTKEIIPGVEATLKLGETSVTAKTNTNGLGVGMFDNVKLKQQADLALRKEFYADTAYNFNVEEFVKGSEEERTLYMRPLKQSITFRDVDADKGTAVKGAKNIISVNGTTRPTAEYSNAAGNFTISGLNADDVISVHASKSGYNDNNYTIKNQKVSALVNSPQTKRNIPLKQKTPPTPPNNGPREGCRAFFTGLIVGDEYKPNDVSEIYKVDKFSEYVGEGNYPDNTKAFPKSVKYTFDGIAIDKGTRVIIYSGKNFSGTVLLDKKGPAIINNVKWKNDSRYSQYNTKRYKEPLQSNFPVSVREWSKSNMQSWSNGSVKVICEK